MNAGCRQKEKKRPLLSLGKWIVLLQLKQTSKRTNKQRKKNQFRDELKRSDLYIESMRCQGSCVPRYVSERVVTR